MKGRCSTLQETEEAKETEALLKKDKAEGGAPKNARLLSSLIATVQGVEVLTGLAVMYMFKDDFKMDPSTLAVVQGFLRVPWTVKPVWAIMSDGVPICGYRRKSYVLIASFLCALSFFLLGLWGHTNSTGAVALLFVYFCGSATCNVIGEALVVEEGREKGSHSGAAVTVSHFFGVRALSFLVMSYLSGFLLDYVSKPVLFASSAAIPLVVFVAAFFLEEKPVVTRAPPARTGGTAESEGATGGDANMNGDGSDEETAPGLGAQLWRLFEVLSTPQLRNAAIFIFFLQCTPTYGNAMFFYFTNQLHMGPELLGRMALASSLAGLLGVVCYRSYLTKVPIRTILVWSTVIVTPFLLLPIVLIMGWNRRMGIADAAFVISDNAAMDFLGQIQLMPVMVLAAQLCPKGLESTIYSALLSANNLGIVVSPEISAVLMTWMGITSTKFDNINWLIVICALTNFIPLAMLHYLPPDPTDGSVGTGKPIGRQDTLAVGEVDEGAATMSAGDRRRFTAAAEQEDPAGADMVFGHAAGTAPKGERLYTFDSPVGGVVQRSAAAKHSTDSADTAAFSECSVVAN